MLAQVIVSKFADHQPPHRQEKIFQRKGVQISRKTMGGWLPPVAELFDPLYQAAKKVLFESKVIGTDDTGVKVLDRKLPFAPTGRIWWWSTTTRRREDATARRDFWKDTKDICKPTPTASTMHFSNPRGG